MNGGLKREGCKIEGLLYYIPAGPAAVTLQIFISRLIESLYYNFHANTRWHFHRSHRPCSLVVTLFMLTRFFRLVSHVDLQEAMLSYRLHQLVAFCVVQKQDGDGDVVSPVPGHRKQRLIVAGRTLVVIWQKTHTQCDISIAWQDVNRIIAETDSKVNTKL